MKDRITEAEYFANLAKSQGTSVVAEMLLESARLYNERNKEYGDNYKEHGDVMLGLFGDGVVLTNVDAFNRFAILVHIVTKLSRYTENFTNGGHNDSLKDSAVYATMRRELDAINAGIGETA